MGRSRMKRASGVAVAALIATLLPAGWSGHDASWAAFPGSNGRIAFERETVAGDHTQVDIFTLTASGTGSRRLTATSSYNEMGPAWSPDGNRVAYWRTVAPFGPGALWVMQADGTHKRRLTNGIDARDPAWNPRGTRLVYTAVGDLSTLRVSDGRARRQLTTGAARDFEPAWSPDGTRIAFTRGSQTGDPGDIYLLTLASGRLTRVTTSSAFDHQVAWSPDGRRLLFERDYDTSFAIFTIRPDGSDRHQLTSGGHYDIAPAWSPDGRYVCFGSDRGTTLHDLWVIGSDGSGLHRITKTPNAAEGFPDWQPRR